MPMPFQLATLVFSPFLLFPLFPFPSYFPLSLILPFSLVPNPPLSLFPSISSPSPSPCFVFFVLPSWLVFRSSSYPLLSSSSLFLPVKFLLFTHSPFLPYFGDPLLPL